MNNNSCFFDTVAFAFLGAVASFSAMSYLTPEFLVGVFLPSVHVIN